MEFLNWVSDHWVLSITFALIASATYAVPRIVNAMCVRDVSTKISSRF
ncbi:hypothetical protein [Bradyrhizobium cenepequi]